MKAGVLVIIAGRNLKNGKIGPKKLIRKQNISNRFWTRIVWWGLHIYLDIQSYDMICFVRKLPRATICCSINNITIIAIDFYLEVWMVVKSLILVSSSSALSVEMCFRRKNTFMFIDDKIFIIINNVYLLCKQTGIANTLYCIT